MVSVQMVIAKRHSQSMAVKVNIYDDERMNSERKVSLALDWLSMKTLERIQGKAWGTVGIQIIQENGLVKEVKYTEITTDI